MKVISQIILVRPDGTLILRHRDDGPSQAESGYVTAFGGVCVDDESPREAAVRLLARQTNLDLQADDLTFWREYPMHVVDPAIDDQVYYFTAHHVASKGLGVVGGRGYALIHSENEAKKLNTLPLLRRVLHDYYAEVSRRHKQPQPPA